ncbi:MAG: hypothetical protein GX247_03085 [Mollicutes bacterium]|nr:hypothetical protein [Mollicutes bacterium]
MNVIETKKLTKYYGKARGIIGVTILSKEESDKQLIFYLLNLFLVCKFFQPKLKQLSLY